MTTAARAAPPRSILASNGLPGSSSITGASTRDAGHSSVSTAFAGRQLDPAGAGGEAAVPRDPRHEGRHRDPDVTPWLRRHRARWFSAESGSVRVCPAQRARAGCSWALPFAPWKSGRRAKGAALCPRQIPRPARSSISRNPSNSTPRQRVAICNCARAALENDNALSNIVFSARALFDLQPCREKNVSGEQVASTRRRLGTQRMLGQTPTRGRYVTMVPKHRDNRTGCGPSPSTSVGHQHRRVARLDRTIVRDRSRPRTHRNVIDL